MVLGRSCGCVIRQGIELESDCSRLLIDTVGSHLYEVSHKTKIESTQHFARRESYLQRKAAGLNGTGTTRCVSCDNENQTKKNRLEADAYRSPASSFFGKKDQLCCCR